MKPCGFECFDYFSVLQNVATTYPGKTHTRKTVQMRSMRICSCYKIWSKTACSKFASKRRGNASFLTNFLLFLQRVCKGQWDKLKILPWDGTGRYSLSKSETGQDNHYFSVKIRDGMRDRTGHSLFFPLICCYRTSFPVLKCTFPVLERPFLF